MGIILRSLTIYEEANLRPDDRNYPRLTLTQPILNLGIPFSPSQVSFFIVGAVTQQDEFIEEELNIKLVNPNEEVVKELIWTVNKDGENTEVQANSEVAVFQIKNSPVYEGKNYVRLYHNGEKIGEQYLEVFIKEEE